MDNHYDPNQARAKDGKWTDGPKSAIQKAKENIEQQEKVYSKHIENKIIDEALKNNIQ